MGLLMKIAFYIYTPAQLYFYKNIIEDLKYRGHEINIYLRDYGETISLANLMKLKFKIFAKMPISKFKKILYIPYALFAAYMELRLFDPDLVIGGGVIEVYASFLLSKKCIIFTDGEPRTSRAQAIQLKLCMPIVGTIITPSCYMDDLGEKHIRVNSYKELAYLHEGYYNPDLKILESISIKESDLFVLLRFNAFDSLHDFGIKGFTEDSSCTIVRELSNRCKVLISSEKDLPLEYSDKLIKVPKNKIHDVIYFAKILIGDTGTMTTEAACLGTPAIMLHPLAHKFGNFVELEEKYELIFCFERNIDDVLNKAFELLEHPNLKDEWKTKRERLLKDKIKMTPFMVWFIENYPDSLMVVKDDPNYHKRFK